jgi:hypothetical protein
MKVFLKSAAFMAALLTTTLVSAQETKIRFFGQPEITSSSTKETNILGDMDPTTYKFTTKDSTYDSKSNFNTGNFVLFVTSQLSERISVLSEVSFNNSGKTFNVEVQRLALKYYVKDYFSIRAGKMFTPIGYWNNQFTLGLVLQPTIQRPLAIRPSGNGGGGVLQFRDTGIQFEGENITNARFFYKVLLGNGVGYYGSSDKADNHIATTVQLGAEPIEGLKIIGSGMFDRIEAGKPNPNGSVAALPDNGNLSLLVGSVAYMNPEKKAEFIFEYLAQTSNFDSNPTTKSHSYYAYAGYKVTDKITPYVLYNSTQAGENTTDADPYFSPVPVKINLVTLGVRYKFNSSFVAKVEYEFNDEKYYYGGEFLDQQAMNGGLPFDPENDSFTNTSKTNSLRVQLAFVF